MIIFIDGPDLVERFRELEDPLVVEGERDRTRQNLTNWVARYCESNDSRAVLVFDDNEPGEKLSPSEHHGQVKVVNLPYGEAAVNEIAGPANRTAVGERVFVVTADWQLLQAVERGKATGLDPGAFVHRVRTAMRKEDEAVPDEPDEKFSGLSKQEVDFWLEFFNDE
jgi:predicted RNA-binding protein with PIN domain